MKNLLLVLISTAFLLFACSEQPGEESVVLPEPLAVSQYGQSADCIWETLCANMTQPGIRPPWSTDCNIPVSNSTCKFKTEICLPAVQFCFFPVKIWWWDVWEVAEFASRHELFSLFDQLHIRPKEEMSIVFPVSDHIIGFQFDRLQPSMRDGKYLLHSAIEIGEETVRELGLRNGVIPSGEYPVVHDRTHQTFTVFFSIRSYPYSLDSHLTYDQQLPKSNNLERFLGLLEPVVSQRGTVSRHPDGLEVSDPDHQTGSFLYSTNGNNLVMNVKDAGVSPFYPFVLDRPIRLSEDIAEAIGIESFTIDPNLVFQTRDRETGEATVMIINPDSM